MRFQNLKKKKFTHCHFWNFSRLFVFSTSFPKSARVEKHQKPERGRSPEAQCLEVGDLPRSRTPSPSWGQGSNSPGCQEGRLRNPTKGTKFVFVWKLYMYSIHILKYFERVPKNNSYEYSFLANYSKNKQIMFANFTTLGKHKIKQTQNPLLHVKYYHDYITVSSNLQKILSNSIDRWEIKWPQTWKGIFKNYWHWPLVWRLCQAVQVWLWPISLFGRSR